MSKNETMVRVGERLRHYREQRGLTQHEFAIRAKVSPHHYKKIERGEVRIGIPILYKFAHALKVPSVSLLGERPTFYDLVTSTKTSAESMRRFARITDEAAFEKGKHWVDCLKEEHPDMADIISRIMSAALKNKNA